MKIVTSARKLKLTTIIDGKPFAALRIADSAPPRTEIVIMVDGRSVTADIATKSLRKAVKTLTENGADSCVLLVQGNLTGDGRIDEAGLVANIKAKDSAA
jgi:hypothetical protein